MARNIVILKNDATGDLIHSMKAIHNMIYDDKVKSITIFISKQSEKFKFLIDHHKVTFVLLNYDLNIFDKIKVFKFILLNKIDEVYILSPKNFYYFLPVFFFKTKFSAICINNINNYKRPNKFLRKFLYRQVINHRDSIFKRESTSEIQNKLSSINKKFNINDLLQDKKISPVLKKYLPKNYIHFHVRKKRLDELSWNITKLNKVFQEFLKYYENVIITKDIEYDENSEKLKNDYSSFDFSTSIYIKKNPRILFFDNIDGEDLYNLVKLSNKVVAFHGMIPSLAWIDKRPVLDLFHCKINNWNDYRNYRNSFYEFKPNYKKYDFIIPSKDLDKTIRKMKFSIKNG